MSMHYPVFCYNGQFRRGADGTPLTYMLHIYKKKYYKTKLSSLYTEDFVEQKNLGELPEDTASTFFVLKKKRVSAIFFGSDGMGADTYQMAFRLLKTYHIPDEMLSAIIRMDTVGFI